MTQIVKKRLVELAQSLNDRQDLLETYGANMIGQARSMGNELIEAKSECDHGEWEGWCEAEIPRISDRQRQKYMRLAKNWGKIESKSAPGALLTINDALSLIASPKTNGKPKPEQSRNNSGTIPDPVADPVDLPEEIIEQLDSLGATHEQMKAMEEFEEDSAAELIESVAAGLQTLDQAIETGEVPVPTLEERMKARNSRCEKARRRIIAAADEILESFGFLDDPYLVELGAVDSMREKIKQGASLLNDVKCNKECPLCEGDGCKHCCDQGMMTNRQYRTVVK